MRDSIAIIGPGRLGTAFARSLVDAGFDATGPHGRGFAGDGSPAALLCVPDSSIAEAASLLPDETLVGHCSGASPLAALGERRGFSLHPLMTFPGGEVHLPGTWCAISGTGPAELEEARRLAAAVGMEPFELREEDRATYHAAASIASNFLVTLQAEAARLAASAGVPEGALAPLVGASLANFMEAGPERALTGPIARGDEETVARQRDALADRMPELLPLFDALADRTRALALRARGAVR